MSKISNSSQNFPGYVAGNKVDLFPSDSQALAGMLKDIDSAKTKIQFESFLFNGEQGAAIADALIAKKKEGVNVEVLLDGKAQKMDHEILANKLRAAGIEVRYYDTSKLKMAPIAIDHTKIAIFDGKVGWEGGVNFDTEINRDLMSRIQGPAVRDVQNVFVNAWNLAGAKTGGKGESLDPVQPMQGDVFIRVTETAPKTDDTHKATLEKLKELKKGDSLELWMMDLGDHDAIKEMVAAKERGVDIKVLLDPSIPFKDSVPKAAQGVVEEVAGEFPDLYGISQLQKAGVDVRYYDKPDGITKLHAKVAIFTFHDEVENPDGTTTQVPRKEAMTGSTNWIKGAFEFNHEMAAFMEGGDVGDQIEGFFKEDWNNHSTGIPQPKGVLGNFWNRIKTGIVDGVTNTLVFNDAPKSGAPNDETSTV